MAYILARITVKVRYSIFAMFLLGFTGVLLSLYDIVYSQSPLHGVLFGFILLTLLPLLNLNSLVEEFVILSAAVPVILFDSIITTAKYPGSLLFSSVFIIVYASLFTFFSYIAVKKGTSYHRIALFIIALVAWGLSSVGYYNGELTSVVVNPVHLAIISTAVFLVYYDSPLIALLGAFSSLVAISMDLSGYADAALVGFNPYMWFTLISLPFMALQLVREYRGLTSYEVYIVPVAVVSVATAIIVGSQSITQLKQLSPYLWLVLPLSVATGGLLITSLQKRVSLLYSFGGSFILGLASYSLANYMHYLYPQLLAITVFTISLLLSLDRKSEAAAIISLFIVLVFASQVVTTVTCTDTVTIQASIDHPVNTTTAKGNTFSVLLGRPYENGNKVYLPVEVTGRVCGEPLELEDSILLDPASFSRSTLHEIMIHPPDRLEVTIYPSESLWSYLVSLSTLNRTLSLDGQYFYIGIGVLFYKESLLSIASIIGAIPISVIVHRVIEGYKLMSPYSLRNKLSSIRRKIFMFIVLTLLIVAPLSLGPLAGAQGLTYEVRHVERGLDFEVTFQNQTITIVSFRSLTFYDEPYDMEFTVYHLKPSTSIILDFRYSCEGQTNTSTIYIKEKGTVRLSSRVSCPDYSKVTINSTDLYVIYSPNDTNPIILKINAMKYIQQYNITNYFIKKLKEYWFSAEVTRVDYGWVNVIIRDAWHIVGKVEIVSHGPFNATRALKLLLQPEELEFWTKTTIIATLTSNNNNQNITMRLEPGQMLLIDSNTPSIVKDRPYSLILYIESPTYKRTINITNTTGAIIFKENKTSIVEINYENVSTKELENGWLQMNITLPVRVSLPELAINYTALNGNYPLVVLGGLAGTGENGSVISVFLAGSGKLDGYVNVFISKTQDYLYVARIPLTIDLAGKAGMRVSKLQALYTIIKSNYRTIEEYPEARYADYIVKLQANETIHPNDFVLITMDINITTKNPVEPIYIYPVIESTARQISGSSLPLEFLINTTNGGKTSWYNPPSKLTFMLPGAYITRDLPIDDSEYYFTLTLIFRNVENLTIKSINMTKISIIGIENSESSTTSKLSLNYIPVIIVGLILIIVLLSRFKSNIKMQIPSIMKRSKQS